jgi:hypothetical protein
MKYQQVKIIDMEILSLKAKPTNRQQRRLMEKEVEWVFKQFEKTLYWMMRDLFNEDYSQYEVIYKYYLKQYIEVSEWINAHKKLKYVTLNPYFFEQFFSYEKSID